MNDDEAEVDGISSYNELIKNFERVRSYMREFYVYGFKSREEYNRKSTRSYDDERRRVESWLGDYMGFSQTPDGKTIFISIDSRSSQHNPFYKALKAKSFTDGDITLHFILFDILSKPTVVLSLPEILEKTDTYLQAFESPMLFEESTVRKKLKEYIAEGVLVGEKLGRKMLYHRTENLDLRPFADALHFYTEVAPCGVIGSFLLDKLSADFDAFTFKHHYITHALDSDVLAMLFSAMQEKSVVTVTNFSRRADVPHRDRIIPLRIFISVQNGRQHLLAYQPSLNTIRSFRIDYLSNVKIETPTPRFDELRAELDAMQPKMWGVTAQTKRCGAVCLESVEFTVKIGADESHIVQRLEREKRVGQVEKIDDRTYRFSCEVYDTSEMLPWIRTFLCRIASIHFSNSAVEDRFKRDLEAMYRIYGIGEEKE